ncbi:flavin reductase [Lutibacter sp. HS1-25]|uniref:flavin reductase family protein n=1 Tax=Lutibacter sp. HS1-25 TaxID=2485000 RepID=UPI0010135373|nr:flavin reductase [Lutibacter sp. HS1-25]RXP61925.1 flavin reductase [Lutibacter sp. HS1-25]
MIYFDTDKINDLNHLYKINLINSCAGYKSANLIATKAADNQANVAIFSSVTHIGSAPPLLGFFLRPTTVLRNTYENILETGYFTINHIHQKILKDAHHTSAKYDKNISEFDVTDLETDYKDNFYAPFVKNCPVQLAMKYVEEYDIKVNNTKLVIGEIQGLYIKENALEKDGFINLSNAAIATINGLDGYAIPNLKQRFEYQRPKI